MDCRSEAWLKYFDKQHKKKTPPVIKSNKKINNDILD